jgi:glycosyltransferase involved in cell wall biosynthesis
VTKPLVTVLIDTYNHGRFIEKAIVSVLEQDFPSDKLEILVVDDGSTDRTPEIVRKFEPRLRLIQKANGGQASAFNVGIPQAQGEIVAFLDGDDWWAANKIKEVAAVFEKNPGLGAVGHGYYEVHQSTAKKEQAGPAKACRLMPNDAAAVRSLYSLQGLLGTSKLAVRKEVLDRILPVPDELVFVADTFIYTLSVALAGAIILDMPLCYYRLHAQNLFETNDPAGVRRRSDMADRNMESVPQRLSALGLSPEVSAAFVEPFMLDMKRSHLSRYGGMTWHTFQVERATNRLFYVETSFGYELFKALVLALTLLIPPRSFYRLKRWYAARGLRKYREKLGNPVPAGVIHLQGKSAGAKMKQAIV